MLGGLGAYIASEVSGSVRRNLTVYGLYGAGVLLILCAAGYGLNALHTVLVMRVGPVTASLWIAGGLLAAGLVAFGFAHYVKNRPRPARPIAKTALVAAPFVAKVVGSKVFGSRTGWRMAALGGVIAIGALLGRQLFSGEDRDGGEDA
jgi:hypothetical protein